MRGLFVTATDTGVGKSVLSAALLAAMSAAGVPVRAYKPVITGLDQSGDSAADAVWPPDDELLASAAAMSAVAVAPLRYGPAASPHLAAELAGERIDTSKLVDRARRTAEGTVLVLEGVGGLMVPIDGAYTVCDLAADLALPLLIAARPGLGTINHTLLTVRAARAAELDVRAVVLTPWPARPGQVERSNLETIRRLGEVEVATLAMVHAPDVGELAAGGDALPWRAWLSWE